eukprot:1175753-Prorocentrum_minimum.AAC.2
MAFLNMVRSCGLLILNVGVMRPFSAENTSGCNRIAFTVSNPCNLDACRNRCTREPGIWPFATGCRVFECKAVPGLQRSFAEAPLPPLSGHCRAQRCRFSPGGCACWPIATASVPRRQLLNTYKATYDIPPQIALSTTSRIAGRDSSGNSMDRFNLE